MNVDVLNLDIWLQVPNIGSLSSGYLSTWIVGVLNSDAQVATASNFGLVLSLPQQPYGNSLLNTLQLGLIGAVSGECLFEHLHQF